MLNGSIRIVPYEARYQTQVLQLAHEMHAESVSHSDLPLDEAKLIRQLETSHSMPDTVYLRLAVMGDEVLGGFFGIITTTFFSDEKAAKDMVWFVRKDRRGGVAALKLVADFEQWGLERGIRKFFLGQSTGVSIETTTRLYEHLGYRVVGMNTVKEVINEDTSRADGGARSALVDA